jgi:HK97 family phage major capsid protein/HK97 family phage prohead protease
MIRKAATAEVAGMEFVLSDATVDRYGDVVEVDGWEWGEFSSNPIALFGHDTGFPIGKWADVRKAGGKLLGRLDLARAGTSARIDELRSLVEQGILRTVSVGFLPIESKPMDAKKGVRFIKQRLVECSLVAVPANPNALAVARSLHISDETIRLAFGEHADGGPAVVRRSTGEHAASQTPMKAKAMTLSDRIVDAQTSIVAMRDALTELSGADALDLDKIEDLNVRIEKADGELAVMKRTEAALAGNGTAIVRTPVSAPAVNRLPFNMAHKAKEIPLGDYVLRAHVINALAKVTQRSRAEVMQERYGNDEMTQKVFNVVTRAASAPATTTTSGWADTLVQTSVAEFIQSLTAASVFPGLSSRGIRTGFGRSGTISFPTRSSTPASVAGAFVAQGAPIPVKQALLAPVSLGIKKLGVITTFTREIAEHSTPDIEGLLRQFITDDTSAAIDAVLVSNSAATAIAPAGIRNGVSTTTVTAGGGFAALVGDVKALTTALVTNSNGNLRSPVWLMNPIQATSIALTQNAGGDFAFAAAINSGSLGGYPVLQSTTITAGMIILVDAADFVSVTGDDMRFDVSDQATIHMEDTTPLPIATGAQGSGVLATPTRSLWQTDSLGLRMIMDLNWSMLRTGTVAWTSAVTW